MAVSTPSFIRQTNLQYLRAALLDLKSATKPQLAERTNLSVITVNALVRDLQDAGEVMEDKVIRPTLGRPAMAYKLNETYCMALIIYTFERDGQDTAFFVVCNLYGDTVEKLEKPMAAVKPSCFDGDIQALLDKYPSIRMIGFGLPATEAGGIIISSDYESLTGCAFCAEREERFHLPVFLLNDVRATTAGYCHNHGIDKSRCVVGLYLPSKYTPGIGVYYDGKLLQGRDGLAGRVSSLISDVQWDKCNYREERYQRAVLELVRMTSCLYNPDLLVVYCETPLDFLEERLPDYFPSRLDRMLIPEIIMQQTLESDFRAGLTHLALEELFRSTFPVSGLEQ